jgi:hypothetical protein
LPTPARSTPTIPASSVSLPRFHGQSEETATEILAHIHPIGGLCGAQKVGDGPAIARVLLFYESLQLGFVDQLEVLQPIGHRDPADAKVVSQACHVVELDVLAARGRTLLDLYHLSLVEGVNELGHPFARHQELRREGVGADFEKIGPVLCAAQGAGTITIDQHMGELVRQREALAQGRVVAVDHDEHANIRIGQRQSRDVVGQAHCGGSQPLRFEQFREIADRTEADTQPLPFIAGDLPALLNRIPSRSRYRQFVGGRQQLRPVDAEESLEPGDFMSESKAVRSVCSNSARSVSCGSERNKAASASCWAN